ncbi:hypothetical protein KUCAC02_002521, partial [Chaenocephalus aceratus]
VLKDVDSFTAQARPAAVLPDERQRSSQARERCVVITLPAPQTRDPNPALSEGETWTTPDHTRNPVIPEEGVLPTKCTIPVYLSLKANYIAAVLCQSKL